MGQAAQQIADLVGLGHFRRIAATALRKPNASADRVFVVVTVLGYASFAALCVAGLNWAVERLVNSSADMVLVDTIIDGFVIAFSSLVLYLLMERRASDTVTVTRLQASEQRFRDMVNTTNGIVWEADATTLDFTFVSEKAVRLLGYPVEDWKRPGFWLEHLHPDDKKWAPEYCVSCTQRLEPHDFEYRFIAWDGRTVWLQDIVTVVIENDAPRWLRGIMVDVTERKNAESFRQTDRESFRDIKGSTIDGYCRTDIQGNLLDVNPTYCLQSGYSREELLRMKIQDLEAQESGPETSKHINRIKLDGYDRFESRHRRKDKSTWPVAVTTTYRDIGEGEMYVFLRDISEHKHNEEELERQREHLEALVLARTEQLRAVSAQLSMTEARERKALALELHDNLSQLLAIIKIKLASLRKGTSDFTIDEIDELIDQADRSTRSIAMQLNPTVLDSYGLVPALEWLGDHMESDYGLRVHIYSNLCGKQFGTEPNAILFRCIRELLINAAKHAGVSEASISCMCDKHQLFLTVSDEGCGFDASIPLASGATDHVFGLGSMSARLANVNGAIDIDSSLGNGTSITITMPCPLAKRESHQDDPDYSVSSVRCWI